MDKQSRTLRSNANSSESSPALPKNPSDSDLPVTLKDLKIALEDCAKGIHRRIDEVLDKRLEILVSEIRSSFQAKFNDLEEIIASQASEIEELKSNQVNSDLKLDALAFSVHEARRKDIANNIIISGIPEEEDVAERVIPPKAEAVLERLDCMNCEIESYFRVGRSLMDKPRLLKVRFRHFSDKVKAVRNAVRLRSDKDFLGVYVNSDLTPEERLERKRLNDKARLLRVENPTAEVRMYRRNLLMDNQVIDSSVPHRSLFRMQKRLSS